MNEQAVMDRYKARVRSGNTLTREEVMSIAREAARAVLEERNMEIMLIHVLEHQAVGSGRVIDPEVAQNPAIPCKTFTYGEDTYGWKEGVLGLISSKKNPEQMEEFCKIRIPAGAGAATRFARIQEAVSEAHEEWERKGGNLADWWQQMSEALARRKVEL